MVKIRYNIIFALVFSPMLASTSIASEVKNIQSEVNSVKITEDEVVKAIDELEIDPAPAIETIINTDHSAQSLKESDVKIDQVKAAIDKTAEKFKVERNSADSEVREDHQSQEGFEAKKEKPSVFDYLKSMDKFKVCSLGHNYNISNYEFIKEQQIEQKQTLIKFKSDKDDKYNCEVSIISEENQDVALKCWKGLKTNVNLSVFKLSYFVGNGYLFMQPEKNRLVLVKPSFLGTKSSCPSNFKPITSKKKSDKEVEDVAPTGLAGLTF